MNAKTQERKFKQTEIGEIHADWGITAVPLANENFFECQNGLWRGKKGPFITAHVIRNTNFTSIGKIDFSDIATLEVEQKQFEKRKLNRGDIIIERSGGGPKQPVGRVVYFADDLEPYSFSNFTSRIRVLDTKTFNPKFIFFVLMNFYQEGRTESLQAKTTGIRNLDFNKYKELVSIPLLNLSEQEKIAEVLTKIQKAVENQEKLVKNLKELKSATMAKLFREGLNGEPLKQTEIGEIPKSWEVMRLGEIVDEIFAGGDVPKNNFSKLITDEYKIPIYTNGEKKQGLYGYTNIIKVSKPSLTISSRGTIGYCVLREKPYFPAIRLIVILPNLNIVSLYYLKFAIEINNFEKYFDKSPIPQLTVPMAKRIIIPLPNKDEQEEIANILTSIDNKIEIEGKKLEVYNEFFSSTLNQLMTGKIRVN